MSWTSKPKTLLFFEAVCKLLTVPECPNFETIKLRCGKHVEPTLECQWYADTWGIQDTVLSTNKYRIYLDKDKNSKDIFKLELIETYTEKPTCTEKPTEQKQPECNLEQLRGELAKVKKTYHSVDHLAICDNRISLIEKLFLSSTDREIVVSKRLSDLDNKITKVQENLNDNMKEEIIRIFTSINQLGASVKELMDSNKELNKKLFNLEHENKNITVENIDKLCNRVCELEKIKPSEEYPVQALESRMESEFQKFNRWSMEVETKIKSLSGVVQDKVNEISSVAKVYDEISQAQIKEWVENKFEEMVEEKVKEVLDIITAPTQKTTEPERAIISMPPRKLE